MAMPLFFQGEIGGPPKSKDEDNLEVDSGRLHFIEIRGHLDVSPPRADKPAGGTFHFVSMG
jgi:hypothetical protein